MSIESMCRSCGRTFARFNSLQRKCGLCSFNLQAKKPMKKIGSVTRKWIDARQKWIADNEPNYKGEYVCYICSQPVHLDVMELDHVKSRSRNPELRFDQSNLSPVHHLCNQSKGSKNYSI